MQRSRRKGGKKVLGQDISEPDLSRVEFHRHGLALMPDPTDRRPGVAFAVKGGQFEQDQRFCSCAISQTRTCNHLLELAEARKALHRNLNGRGLDEAFRASVWHRLASILVDGLGDDSRFGLDSVHVKSVFPSTNCNRCESDETGKNDSMIKVFSYKGEAALFYFSQGPDCSRLIERCEKTREDDTIPNRGTVLDRLALLTMTEGERIMSGRGGKTRRQVLEESFWYRLCYHCYREFGPTGCTFYPSVEHSTGSFTVTASISGTEDTDSQAGKPVFLMVIPRTKVRRLLDVFKDLIPNQHGLAIHPVPLKSIFEVTMNTELDLEIRPLIQVIQEGGEERFFEKEGLGRFLYEDLVYIKELGILAELEKPRGLERKFRAPKKMVLKKSQVPSFLDEFGEDLLKGAHLVDEKVRALKIFRQFDRLEIMPDALERDWCWLSVQYGYGNTSVSLIEILQAKKDGQRYIGTPEGWVDCRSPDLDGLDPILKGSAAGRLSAKSSTIRLSRMDLFRLQAAGTEPLGVTGDDERSNLLKKMLKMKPARPLPRLKGSTSTLRPYQERGVEWIRFLFENGFGGLLCDEMGLGKTHEVMSFMVYLREHEMVKSPFLVVCPTTVLSHWSNKIREHSPALKETVYHGGQRDFTEVLRQSDVIVTSYGILRKDIEKLEKVKFSLAVFDEVQSIKNPQTLAYWSARDIRAGIKLGLTGTPIENSLNELKAHLDLTVPGYLGDDEEFESRYIRPIEIDADDNRRKELIRLISPFTLRRRKETVLDDLPEKIEDIRVCSLSPDQVKLYRDAIASRGKNLLDTLKDEVEPIPYIHIFALLNLLKQICNHPAMVEGSIDEYEKYESGKWELFKQLIAESLDSGQKVVIYSQFLAMIQIVERYLQDLDVDFVTLTGKSVKRGQIISRFNNDPACRIYLGSLKAGGAGVDLVAASVVIHYDRWWNAAKEDQATDRVHRIGQRRGVQVFKLVTEGTLEEKISAIIEKKRDLMDSVIKENDPGILKTFSRKELIGLLAVPEG
ncbi:MAG: DEAD/DEAH box helicase [Thermodesulfobacteriota bacterium]|nr:DEAD/DEAH box helicase [Thermodesulfobacteriota bacterium]